MTYHTFPNIGGRMPAQSIQRICRHARRRKCVVLLFSKRTTTMKTTTRRSSSKMDCCFRRRYHCCCRSGYHQYHCLLLVLCTAMEQVVWHLRPYLVYILVEVVPLQFFSFRHAFFGGHCCYLRVHHSILPTWGYVISNEAWLSTSDRETRSMPSQVQ
jgi:hypothetical protein